MTKLSKTVTIKDYEAHLGSICVSIVFGVFGGYLGLLLIDMLTNMGINSPTLVQVYICGHSGFFSAWLICKYWFKTLHKWYGHYSYQHRIYDTTGIISGILLLLFVR